MEKVIRLDQSITDAGKEDHELELFVRPSIEDLGDVESLTEGSDGDGGECYAVWCW
jgi:hypothetical protein